YGIERVIVEPDHRKIYVRSDDGGLVPGYLEQIFVFACSKNINLVIQTLTKRKRVLAGAGIYIEQVFIVGKIEMLFDQISEPSCPIGPDVKVAYECKLLLGFCHISI